MSFRVQHITCSDKAHHEKLHVEGITVELAVKQ
eukprot:COSAG02_NODE_59889_length_273_cov_0.574713_1_plen_32_part_10